MIWMWCIPSRWHPSLYSVMLYASPSSPVLFNISIANWNLRIIDVNNGFFLYWRKHVDKRLHNSYWNPEINYTHFRYFLYSSPASRNIFLKTIYAQRSKIFIPVGLSAFIKTLLCEIGNGSVHGNTTFIVCGIMWVIKTMHDGDVIIQSVSLNSNTGKDFKFPFSLLRGKKAS